MEEKEKTTDTSPLTTLWNNLAALIKVKTIVTLVVIGVFAALALTGALQPDTVMTIVSMVVAFYFGTQTKKE
nr:hypothetical protein [uncultured Gemmiger sp.]